MTLYKQQIDFSDIQSLFKSWLKPLSDNLSNS